MSQSDEATGRRAELRARIEARDAARAASGAQAEAGGATAPAASQVVADAIGGRFPWATSHVEWAAQVPWKDADAARGAVGERVSSALRDAAPGSRTERARRHIEASGVTDDAQKLATAEGRSEAQRELGVYAAGKLGERFGLADGEAARLLQESRALATREGRQRMLAEQAGRTHDALALRSGSIQERREQTRALLESTAGASLPQRAARGAIVGGVIALVVLILVLIACVSLLGSLADGSPDAAAALVDQVQATRPGVGWFAGAWGSA
ncbi:hypothetical protein [Microbacterium sp. gxy059]|uniref:hypothetical protein n=1 Tax=Microbacterium sp. gxy059 TaxID=2957199 RepID=UPI003D97CDF3